MPGLTKRKHLRNKRKRRNIDVNPNSAQAHPRPYNNYDQS